MAFHGTVLGLGVGVGVGMDMACCGMAQLGTSRYSMAWHGRVWGGAARHAVERHGMAWNRQCVDSSSCAAAHVNDSSESASRAQHVPGDHRVQHGRGQGLPFPNAKG